ncbi:MAG TPA: LacI family DNA-binding transcriptional regulator [Candidatus Limnocylindrales bacterium]|nr:LacI family DNA-binding transcriptional regulator [Candidatus Limnocylindrales bacterium]
MGYAEKRGDYWRARYKLSPGKYGTVQDDAGTTIRFRTKREAETAANDAEATVRAGTRRHTVERITFGEYVNIWYARQDLALSTMQNYRHHIEEHLLPAFEGSVMPGMRREDVIAWERRERAAGYAESSIKSWRSTLHLILADAEEEGLITSNPAARRRNRGKRAGRSRRRGPEKAITTALGVLLIAERAALLSGRDDELVAILLKGFTGMRWGELVGLESCYFRPTSVRIEWQLYELDNGVLHRCPPKDDSYRDIHTPDWLNGLVCDHITRTRPKPCPCHSQTYAFTGHRPSNGAPRKGGATLADVARRAGVSLSHTSAALNHPEEVAENTRAAIASAMVELGYVRGGWTGELAAHWRRNGFATWLFHPAATGRFPKKGKLVARPVPVLGDPWPGLPVRGRNATGRADACWLPIASGLTPHSLRHTYKTLMEELGTPAKLMDQQMGHDDGSVQARYSHATQLMVQRLMEGLTELWEAALDIRREMAPGSPVAVLDRLLRKGELE